MKPDVYTRILLTIIAACLVALAVLGGSLVPAARAAAPISCRGEMHATSSGPLQASIGASYRIEVTCN